MVGTRAKVRASVGLTPNSNEVAERDGAGQSQTHAEQHQCPFCHSPLTEEVREALECGHVFHTECLDRYVEVTGKRRREACPYKCHQ